MIDSGQHRLFERASRNRDRGGVELAGSYSSSMAHRLPRKPPTLESAEKGNLSSERPPSVWVTNERYKPWLKPGKESFVRTSKFPVAAANFIENADHTNVRLAEYGLFSLYIQI